jgi:hypothetical protein
MEVQFTLDEADLTALAKFRMRHSPAFRRRYRIGWVGVPLGFGLTGLVLYVFFSLKSPALYLVGFGLFFLVFYPYYYRWLVGRTMRKIVSVRSNPKALGRRRVRVTPQGLEMVGGGSTVKTSWDRVSGIEVNPVHVFVAVDGEYAIVLPRSSLGDETFQRLMETIRKFAQFRV